MIPWMLQAHAVYLYDEKVLITFNYKDGSKTISFGDVAAKDAPEGNGSDLVDFAPPRERLCRNTRAFFFCTNSKLTQAGGFEPHRPPLSVPAAKSPSVEIHWGFFQKDYPFIGTKPTKSLTTSPPMMRPATDGTKALEPGTERRMVHLRWVPGGQMQ